MTHPIVALQGALVAALNADAGLTALIGEAAVFDAPPKGKLPPYVAIARHGAVPRDGDAAPGLEHRVILHIWVTESSRKAVLAVADRVAALVATASLSGPDLTVSHKQLDRTDTAVDLGTGFMRAALTFRFFSEPN